MLFAYEQNRQKGGNQQYPGSEFERFERDQLTQTCGLDSISLLVLVLGAHHEPQSGYSFRGSAVLAAEII